MHQGIIKCFMKKVYKSVLLPRKKMKREPFDLVFFLLSYVTLNKPEMKWFEHERTFECHNRVLVI